jgi:predicted patatin/cPLA2 family phospholipase
MPHTLTLDALATALSPREARGGRKVALVHEGGGMRGSFGAGVLSGIAEAGLPSTAFDALYGVSAGLLNLMYWISRRHRDAPRIYVDQILRDRERPFFLHRGRTDMLYRLARGRPVIDLGIVEHTLRETRPIDPEAVRSHPSPIWFPITRARDLATEFRDARSLSEHELIPTLIAAATVPALADPPAVEHEAWIDGAIGSPLPVREAVEHGITDLVAVLNLPIESEPAWYEPILLGLLAPRRGLSPRIARVVHAARATRRDAIRMLRSPESGLRVTVLAPLVRPGHTLERDERVLEEAIAAGTQLGLAAVERARARMLTAAPGASWR